MVFPTFSTLVANVLHLPFCTSIPSDPSSTKPDWVTLHAAMKRSPHICATETETSAKKTGSEFGVWRGKSDYLKRGLTSNTGRYVFANLNPSLACSCPFYLLIEETNKISTCMPSTRDSFRRAFSKLKISGGAATAWIKTDNCPGVFLHISGISKSRGKFPPWISSPRFIPRMRLRKPLVSGIKNSG